MKCLISILFLLCLSANAQHEMKRMSVGSLQQASSGAASSTPDILWWKFQDGSGTTVTAAVGTNGTTDAAWVTGKSGSGFALDANGTSQEAQSSSVVTFNTNIVTVALWAFLDATNSFRMLFESGTGAQTDSFTCYTGNNVINAFVYGTTGVRTEVVSVPTTNYWYHLLLVFDNSTGNGDLKIYIDGVEKTTTPSTSKTGTSNFTARTLNLFARNAASSRMDGKLDDVRIYSGDRSADAVSIMNDPQ